MTVWNLWTPLWVALCCATLVYGWREVKPLLLRVLTVYEQDHAAVRTERRQVAETNAKDAAATTEIIDLPPDLVAQCGAWGEGWAKDQALARVAELYAICDGNWDRVRQIFAAEQTATALGSTGAGRA